MRVQSKTNQVTGDDAAGCAGAGLQKFATRYFTDVIIAHVFSSNRNKTSSASMKLSINRLGFETPPTESAKTKRQMFICLVMGGYDA
jgi:hypothetical protein